MDQSGGDWREDARGTGVVSEAALVGVFRSTLPELYAFVARRVGGERTLAEDMTQETWLRAMQAWRRDGLPRTPLAWLKTTARNLMLNHFRNAHRRSLVDVPFDLEAHGMAGGGSASLATTPDVAALVHHALARLRGSDAALVEAFHFDGRSTRELALELGVTERAVEGRLHRARLRLKQLLLRSPP